MIVAKEFPNWFIQRLAEDPKEPSRFRSKYGLLGANPYFDRQRFDLFTEYLMGYLNFVQVQNPVLVDGTMG